MKKALTLLSILCSLSIGAQTIIPLRESTNPQAKEGLIKGGPNTRVLYNTCEATLEVFVPEKPSKSAMLVVPGGGFMILSYDSEGTDVARKLNEKGITAFVLKYRTTPLNNEDGSPANGIKEVFGAFKRNTIAAKASVMGISPDEVSSEQGDSLGAYYWCSTLVGAEYAYSDADLAMKYIREHAKQYGVTKVGMMGFSAGAVTTLHQAQFHTPETRPDFVGVIYGGWDDSFTVPDDGMPMFLCSPTRDIFTPEESLRVYLAWRAKGFEVEHHFYQKAGHGYGVNKVGESEGLWLENFFAFAQDCGFIK